MGVGRAAVGNGIPHADQLNQLQVVQVRQARVHQAFHEGPGLRNAGSEEDTHSRFDLCENDIRGNHLFLPVQVVEIEHV
jgi:hypothetical protein